MARANAWAAGFIAVFLAVFFGFFFGLLLGVFPGVFPGGSAIAQRGAATVQVKGDLGAKLVTVTPELAKDRNLQEPPYRREFR